MSGPGLMPLRPGAGDSSHTFQAPWLDYATVAVPENHQTAIWWSQYLWLTDGNYRTAMQRVASHFLTEIEFPELEADEESEWRDLFTKQLDYKTALLAAGAEYLCYGNVFQTMYLPFDRMLICGECQLVRPIREVDYRLELNATSPHLTWRANRTCPKCGKRANYRMWDVKSRDLSRVRYASYYPAEVDMAMNPYSQRKTFDWKPTATFCRDVLNGVRLMIDDTPVEVLETVACNGRLRFQDGAMLHVAEPSLSGTQSHGWGIPRSISNFRTAWLNQLNNKMDQAIAIDYTLGMRLISPAATNGGVDPMVSDGMENFVANMRQIINTHRDSPTSYHTVPYPVNYQFLGGESGQLMPFEKLKFRQQEYLNQLGVPLEYHNGTLSTQAAPMALRLFETFWQAMPSLYNRILTWTVANISATYGFEPTKVTIQKTTIADDMERKSALLQLMSANQLSPQTALAPFGINAYDESKKVMSYQKHLQKQQMEADRENADAQEMGAVSQLAGQTSPSALLAQQQQAGGAGAGPAPAPAGAAVGGVPGAGAGQQSLAALSDQAAQLAQQLISMDEFSRKQQLRELRKGNPALHALVKQQLAELRQQAGSQGRQMLLQQPPPG